MSGLTLLKIIHNRLRVHSDTEYFNTSQLHKDSLEVDPCCSSEELLLVIACQAVMEQQSKQFLYADGYTDSFNLTAP